MSEQDAAKAVEAPLNDTESGCPNVLLSDEAARNLPARIFLKEGPAFVISPRMDLPAFLHDGEHTLVVINAVEYRELVAVRGQQLRQSLAEARTTRQPAVRLGLSTIERDPEVANFLRERFQGGVTIAQLHAACMDRFGSERTPSDGRIKAFRRKTRNTSQKFRQISPESYWSCLHRGL